MIPSLFISHGSPALAIEDNKYTRFLQDLGKQCKPKAIVLFTAHWENEMTTISYRDDMYETIYDFGGFPKKLYQLTYPAKGSTTVASLVEKRLAAHGIPSQRNEKRGLDHGSWVVLYLMYPSADIPVIQVSINPNLLPKEQFKIGEALRDLGRENILLLTSGGTSHNLGMIKWGQDAPEPWTVKFDDWIIKHLQNKDVETLFNYQSLAPNAQLAVPSTEHFVPFFIALGSGQEHKTPKLLHRSYAFGTLSQIAFEF